MGRKMLDMKCENARFTCIRGDFFPLSIQTRSRDLVSGVRKGVTFVSLSDYEARFLFNFLADYFMPTGVPDGG